MYIRYWYDCDEWVWERGPYRQRIAAADKTRKNYKKIEIANGGRRWRKYTEREKKRADKYDRRIIRVHATTLIQYYYYYYYYFVVSRAHCRVWQKHARALRARASGAAAAGIRARRRRWRHGGRRRYRPGRRRRRHQFYTERDCVRRSFTNQAHGRWYYPVVFASRRRCCRPYAINVVCTFLCYLHTVPVQSQGRWKPSSCVSVRTARDTRIERNN